MKPPNLIPFVDKSILENLEIKTLSCKPEAPWIKRSGNAFKFTEEIRDDIAINETSSDNIENLVFLPQDLHKKYRHFGSKIKVKAGSENNLKDKNKNL